MPTLLAAPLVDVAALGKVLVVSVVAGAGLVAVFALGLVGVSAYCSGAQPGPAAAGGTRRRGTAVLGLGAAVACFAVVVFAIGFGLHILLASK